jgi:hypothetical protein
MENPFKYEIVLTTKYCIVILMEPFDQELIIFNDSGDAKIGIDHVLPKRVCLILEFTVLQYLILKYLESKLILLK